VPSTLTHAVTKHGQSKGTEFRRTYHLPFAPTNGLRISLGYTASFTVEDLVYHVDADNFSCRTQIECGPENPLDDILSYYEGIGYRVVG